MVSILAHNVEPTVLLINVHWTKEGSKLAVSAVYAVLKCKWNIDSNSK